MGTQTFSGWQGSSHDSHYAQVLLVESDPNDVRLTRDSLKGSKRIISLHHIEDGVEFLAFLRKEGRYGSVSTPDLILLDRDTPRMNVHEVLAVMMSDEVLRHVPVVILSAWRGDQDESLSCQLGCIPCVVKPWDYAEFQQVIRTIADDRLYFPERPSSRCWRGDSSGPQICHMNYQS